MAKGLRSKIKRKFRTELRKKIGVPHLAVQEAKIQENLKKAIESQGAFWCLTAHRLEDNWLLGTNERALVRICATVEGKSVLQLKKLMGTATAPVATGDVSMEVDAAATPAKTEAELLNSEALAAAKKLQKREAKKLAAKRRKKKFVHFHTLRKKGV